MLAYGRMPFLKKLLADAVQRAASDPRVREAAKQIYEDKVKPSAEAVWAKAKPEIEDGLRKAKPKVEEAWERAKPQVAAAGRKAVREAGNISERVRKDLQERAAMKDPSPPKH